MGKIARQHADRRENYNVMKLLHEHVRTIGEGFCEYDDGWSDARVAREARVERDISKASVANARVDVFGKLKVSPLSETSKTRVETLEKTVETMAAYISALLDKHNRLCDTLQTDKVAIVGHLKVKTNGNAPA